LVSSDLVSSGLDVLDLLLGIIVIYIKNKKNILN